MTHPSGFDLIKKEIIKRIKRTKTLTGLKKGLNSILEEFDLEEE